MRQLWLGDISRVRKQYNFWPGERGLDAWDVDRLIELSRDLPVIEVPLDSISEIDSAYWFLGEGQKPTVRSVVEHALLIAEVDLSFPFILAFDGRVMDGMHRVARSLMDGNLTIHAVRFENASSPTTRTVSRPICRTSGLFVTYDCRFDSPATVSCRCMRASGLLPTPVRDSDSISAVWLAPQPRRNSGGFKCEQLRSTAVICSERHRSSPAQPVLSL